MNPQKTLKKSALITLVFGMVGLALALLIYLLPAGAITKRAATSLTIDYPLAVSYRPEPAQLESSQMEHDSQMEHQEHMQNQGQRKVEAIMHHYRPTQVVVFKGRTYTPISGFRYTFDGKNAQRLDGSVVYFLTRAKEDLIAPITAIFGVNWRLEGRKKDGSRILIDQGNFKGILTEGGNSAFPREKRTISGATRIGVEFDSLDSKLLRGSEGWYDLKMSARINYKFLTLNGRGVSDQANHTVFKAKVNYANGKRGKIELYYPLESVTKQVVLKHPVFLRLKQNVSVLGFTALLLIMVSIILSTVSSKLASRA